MSGRDRRPYLSSSVLDQALLDLCADNFETKIEMIVDIEKPDGGFIRASDRNKYVGGVFYEALLQFPVTSRTLGEWLSPTLQFSTVSLELSNADGRFSVYLPGGSQYNAFIGRSVTVSIGLAESQPTYRQIFSGTVTDVGGVSRGRYSISFIARDRYEKLNQTFPKQALTREVFSGLEEGNIGKLLPVIYGDWTVSLEPQKASIPAYVLNGGLSAVNGGTEELPDTTRADIQFIISENPLLSFDKTNVYLLKSDVFYKVPDADVLTDPAAQNRFFSIKQNTTNWVGEEPYLYSQGDEFFVRVKGKGLFPYLDNAVAQAKDILLTQGGATIDEFDTNWSTFRDKSSPPQSAVSAIRSRAWIGEETTALEYALSLLEQIRLEAFIDKDGLIKLNSLHLEDFNAHPSFTVKNWDVIEDSLTLAIDDQHNFNRGQGTYDYRPASNENSRLTRFIKNDAAIAQVGREISKSLTYPNLYVQDDVENQVTETIRLASASFEVVTCDLTWRALLLDLGEFVLCNFEIGSILYSNVPAMIRSKGYNAEGIKLPMTLWSMQLVPFNGYTPGYVGTVGGSTAVISKE